MQSLTLVLIFQTIVKFTYGDLTFPAEFKFGVATASYQIEGGWNTSGKGENIWDRLTHSQPSWTTDHQNGDIACDSYNLWREDIKLLTYLNVDYYRFSISWSRLLPSGLQNYINPDGVRYYNDLINELLINGIEPIVTLYHWDLPQPLQDLGGWPNPVLSDYFLEYSKIAFELFGDRVKIWITFNEPSEVCSGGYGGGVRAPLISVIGVGDYLCGKTILLAHAKAYRAYDEIFRSKQNGRVGIVVSAHWYEPKTSSIEDYEAAERARQMEIGWWLHPILSKTGDYPPIMKEQVANLSLVENFKTSRLPKLSDEEIYFIRGTYDYLGVNHYTTFLVSNQREVTKGKKSRWSDYEIVRESDPNWKSSGADWLKDVPWGFRKLLNWIKNQYNNPVVIITENGYADEGEIDDIKRIEYYKGYLLSLLQSIYSDGCKVEAYLTWSLLDNMEWDCGYTVKFGLFYVNFTDPNRDRLPKLSAKYFKDLVESKLV